MAAHSHHPIQNSEVYVLTASSHTSHPVPPSPPTPCEPRALSPAPSDEAPVTPLSPADHCSPSFARRITTAVHVLGTEATALSCLTRLYETDPVAQQGFNRAVGAITDCVELRGKLIICGVGKSGHIAKKLVATMNSLRIPATFLHPTEALHGDLGKVGDHDVILLITFSGRTPELMSLLPHFNPRLPMLAITSHIHPSTCAIVDVRPDTILLPAPIHESESLSFGVSAPTTSTTIALALGDALAVTISNELHPNVSEVFLRNHPGGAIGQAIVTPKHLVDIAIPLEEIPRLENAITLPQAVHVIMQGYQSSSGWVRYNDNSVSSPRAIKTLKPHDMTTEAIRIPGLVVPSEEWLSLIGDTTISDAAAQVIEAKKVGRPISDEAILAVIVRGEVAAVVEVATLLANV